MSQEFVQVFFVVVARCEHSIGCQRLILMDLYLWRLVCLLAKAKIQPYRTLEGSLLKLRFEFVVEHSYRVNHLEIEIIDQMFWQMYQNLMLSGFLSSGNLCLIHNLKLFWPHAASSASDRKGAKIQHEFSWFCQKSFFQNIKI